MIRKRSLVLVSVLLALGCHNGTSLKGGHPDAAAGGSGGSGGTVGGTTSTGGAATGGAAGLGGTISTGGKATGGTLAVGGTASTGGNATGGASLIGTTATGGSAAGGASTGTGARGGATTTSGGSATGGATVGGSGGASTGGQTGSSGPADDSPGQNPFARPAGSGILITSSDGLNSTDLILAADSKDGMFVAGATRNPQAMGLAAFDSGVVSEAFTARLDAQGKLVWTVPLKTCGVPADIAAGPGDAVFVLCPYEPDVTTLMPSTCDASALVTKLSGDGKVVFQASVAAPATPADGYMCPYGLGVDAQGRSYVGGSYSPNDPSAHVLLTAVTAAGQQDWTLISDGPAFDPTNNTPAAFATGVDVDSNGNVLFVGAFNLWMKVGTTQITSQAVMGQFSMENGFFGRVSTSGTGATASRFGGTVFDMATSVAPTTDGGFLLGGWASASASIAGKTVSASQDGSALVALINSQGQASWAKVIPGKTMADGVALGLDGKAYVVGLFTNDEILYTYDPAADTLTARKTVSGNANDNALRTHSVAVSTSGSIWLTGTFQGTINVGTGALSTTTVSAFLLKLN